MEPELIDIVVGICAASVFITAVICGTICFIYWVKYGQESKSR